MATRKDKKGNRLRKGESQRGNGTYSYRWVDANQKPQSIYAPTLEELREKEEEVQHEIIHKVVRTCDTLEEQVARYLELKSNIKASTRSNYEYYYNKEIKGSKFGKLKIIDLKKSDVLMFYKTLSDKGFSNGTVAILHRLIHPALELAFEDGMIMKNPSDGCMKDYGRKKEVKYALTHEEEKEFLDRVLEKPRTNKLYPLFGVLLYSGLRISECVGLTWKDINMDKREVSVNHQLLTRSINGEYVIYAQKTTKTDAGKRVIPMNDFLYDMFKKQRRVWLETEKDINYEVDGYSNFVFLSYRTGRPYSPNSIRRTMREIVAMNDNRNIQLPNISPHILRHTACTRMAEAGIDLKAIQVYMGHNDARTTLEVYNHVDKERLVGEVDKLNEFYRKFS